MPGAEHDEATNPEKYKNDRGRYQKNIGELFVGIEQYIRTDVSEYSFLLYKNKII
jgi:hypothetical protein